MSFSQIPWFLLCGGLTAVGLIGSWFTLRRRGPRAAARVFAWALLPIALYLVGILQVLWRFGVAIGDFFSGLVFSPKVYTGLIIAGIALVLFVVTGGLRSRSGKKPEGDGKKPEGDSKKDTGSGPGQLTAGPAVTTGRAQPAAAPAKRKGATPADEDFDEVAQILKRHGIS
jgi:hypothetical protein